MKLRKYLEKLGIGFQDESNVQFQRMKPDIELADIGLDNTNTECFIPVVLKLKDDFNRDNAVSNSSASVYNELTVSVADGMSESETGCSRFKRHLQESGFNLGFLGENSIPEESRGITQSEQREDQEDPNSLTTPTLDLGNMPRYREEMSESAPLRGSNDWTCGDRDDVLGVCARSNLRNHTKMFLIASAAGIVAITVMVSMAVVSIVLRSADKTPTINTTLSSGTKMMDSDLQKLLRLQWPLPDVESIKRGTLGKDEKEWNFADSKEKGLLREGTEKTSTLTSIPVPVIPILFMQSANMSTIQDGIEAGREARKLREETETKLLNSGFVPKKRSAVSHHQYFRRVTPKALQMASDGFLMEKAYKSIVRKLNMTKEEAIHGLLIVNGTMPTDYCIPANAEVQCNKMSAYRNADGSCNNLKHLFWGSANQPFRRILMPDYSDGISVPRSSAIDSSPLPNPREVSLNVHPDKYTEDTQASLMFPLWGQFVDHDLTGTAASTGANGTQLSCCLNGRLLEIQHPECFPIYLAPVDNFYSSVDQQCMSVLRSAPHPSCELGPRQQFNQLTSFLDASNVYGSSDLETSRLRVNQYGRLRAFTADDGRALLPILAKANDSCNTEEEIDNRHYCFKAGDSRVNEVVTLTSMHTIWMRQHNEVTDNLVALNPHWDDETVFQESRRIVIAQMQHITYNEFLPPLLGAKIMEKTDLKLLKTGYYQSYDPEVDPTVSNVFAAAAFRFGHSMMQGLVRMVGPRGKNEDYIQLHKLMFNPFRLWTEGRMDAILRGTVTAPAGKVDSFFTNQISKHLFQSRNDTFGLDLVAVNIHRGRDHGLPTYPAWRKACGLSEVNEFSQLQQVWDAATSTLISSVYKSVLDVDLYTGLLAEKPIQGGMVGPTLTCLLADQFLRLKIGDRFWYEGDIQIKPFTPEQLKSIRKTTLARVLCDNGDDLKGMQLKAMFRPSETNPILDCSGTEIPRLNYQSWKENNQSTHRSKVKAIPPMESSMSDLEEENWGPDDLEISVESKAVFNDSIMLDKNSEAAQKQRYKGILLRWNSTIIKSDFTENNYTASGDASTHRTVSSVVTESKESVQDLPTFKMNTTKDGVMINWPKRNSSSPYVEPK